MLAIILFLMANAIPQAPQNDAPNPQHSQGWLVGRNLSAGEECLPEEVMDGCWEYYDQNQASTWVFAPSIFVWRT